MNVTSFLYGFVLGVTLMISAGAIYGAVREAKKDREDRALADRILARVKAERDTATDPSVNQCIAGTPPVVYIVPGNARVGRDGKWES